MPLLKTHTLSTRHPDTFLVYWSNCQNRPGGLLKVRVKRNTEDLHIVAELAAIQFLLEDKCVIGQDAEENATIKLIVSSGAIKKLQRMQSDKTHLAPYANFLITRFAACKLEVNKNTRWFDGFNPEHVEELLVGGPRREKLRIAGLGEDFFNAKNVTAPIRTTITTISTIFIDLFWFMIMLFIIMISFE